MPRRTNETVMERKTFVLSFHILFMINVLDHRQKDQKTKGKLGISGLRTAQDERETYVKEERPFYHPHFPQIICCKYPWENSLIMIFM